MATQSSPPVTIISQPQIISTQPSSPHHLQSLKNGKKEQLKRSDTTKRRFSRPKYTLAHGEPLPGATTGVVTLLSVVLLLKF